MGDGWREVQAFPVTLLQDDPAAIAGTNASLHCAVEAPGTDSPGAEVRIAVTPVLE